MFKGLRTKIESEQKDPVGIKASLTQPKLFPSSSTLSASHSSYHPSISHQLESSLKTPSRESSNPTSECLSVRDNATKIEARTIRTNPASSNIISCSQHESDEYDGQSRTIDQLQNEVQRLNAQLKTVIKERDDSNDQNGQLYQLIEKLRRNLENEKEINSNLEAKLGEAEARISEKHPTKNDPNKRIATHAKSIDPSLMIPDPNEVVQTSDVEKLRKDLIDLQSQIMDKNRQIKILQQNLNDIKRHLHKEIFEHSKTQEELLRSQNKLKQSNQDSLTGSDNVVVPQNGSSLCDGDFNNGGLTVTLDDNAGVITEAKPHSIHNNGLNDTTRVSESISSQAQFDNLSCISRGSNSVDDNDLQDHLHHSSSKEINNEYLKNVLFRYMTSTDTETAKHLVKALSVMMNFTPEQASAIKNAMNARSSWLRLR